MRIDRERVTRVFREYAGRYDAADSKVRLKIEHTFRVAELCERIALNQGLDREEVDLAWLSGMLHDLGRFEQLRRFGTFDDSKSIDHAACGVQILFGEGKIRDYTDSGEEDALLRDVIACHSAYEVPKEYGERTALFANILRDGDKIDILRVNVEVPPEEIYNVSPEELREAEVTPQVLEAFLQGGTVLRSLKRTSVDNLVSHASLVYGLVFPISLRIVKEQGYLERLLDFESRNPETRQTFALLRERLRELGAV